MQVIKTKKTHTFVKNHSKIYI